MRLLYVLDRFPVLSETFVVNEVRGLLRAGDDVTVYARRLRERGALHALAEAAWLARHVRADHVHAHFAFGNATVALLYGRLTGAPASFTAHAVDLYGGVPRAVLGRKIAASAFAAAVSEHGAAELRACAAPVDRSKVVVQRNGVARDALRAAEPESPPRIVAIARLIEKKGLDTLIRAASLLDGEVVVELVGDGPERERPGSLARECDVRGVLFTGTLNHDAALGRLTGATAFALTCRQLPSGDRDGLPVSLVEAMSAGVPVVTTPIGGIPELVRNGETGLLVSPDDPVILAAALKRLLDDRPLRNRLAAAGRAATEPWEIGRCIANLRARF
ncbi:MAG: colanic acid biosynthesis glycosyltransferase WcaL, partial [Thermoleophilia bacterium]|nr:colanic acid biosynthesis glycosyltransferase WcaL [Thermoleophilia bacterium]